MNDLGDFHIVDRTEPVPLSPGDDSDDDRAETGRAHRGARKLGIADELINVQGGAIAHGHPIGATGAVLTTRLLHSMRRDGLKRGIVTLCIGGGQGIAAIFERV